jgi:23S rRNA (pseudouridine1915-N3)-methyltransferase
VEITVAAVGRMKAGPEAELCARYLDRATKTGRVLGLRGFEVHETGESRAARGADRIAEEEVALLAATAKSGQTICLDPAGDNLDSETFAGVISAAITTGLPSITFVIGGPDGLGARILAMRTGAGPSDA